VSDTFSTPTDPSRILLIACGALAHEIVALKAANRWEHLDVQCLPAELHNRPHLIPEAVRGQIAAHRDRYPRIFVAYADCGTGGLLDRVLEEEQVERIAGAHCYEFYAGAAAFAQMHDDEPGTFYVTDFLLRHFERLVVRALGIDRHPELMPQYFGRYERLVFLAQLPPTPDTLAQARAAADRLGLALEVRHTGYGELASSLESVSERPLTWHR
jgi:Protein of unknown function (DUF1638)